MSMISRVTNLSSYVGKFTLVRENEGPIGLTAAPKHRLLKLPRLRKALEEGGVRSASTTLYNATQDRDEVMIGSLNSQLREYKNHD